jgi:hypothetical protein
MSALLSSRSFTAMPMWSILIMGGDFVVMSWGDWGMIVHRLD